MAASRVACASFNIGTNTTITITRDKSSYTHTITYKFGSATGTIVTKTTQTSIVWSPVAATLYAQIPNAASGYGTITCQTYDGNTLIGTTSAGFYAYAVKENCLPAVSAVIEDVNASVIAVTGDKTKLVRYISKPKVTMTATAKNSATIQSRQIYNPVGLTATTSPYTFDTVYSDEFRIKAVDSRGYSTEVSQKVGFVEYDPAYFNYSILKRTESTSTTARADLKGFCFKGNFGAADNTLTLKYRIKEGSGAYGSYVSISGATWNSNGSFEASIDIPNMALDKAYTVEFVVADKLSTLSVENIIGQAKGDIRIGENYIHFKNDLTIGDEESTNWSAINFRRKIGGSKFMGNIGMGYLGNNALLAFQLEKGTELLGRLELRADTHFYNLFSGMSFAEMMSSAPSAVTGGAQGNMLLNGGDSAAPVLLQWGAVRITPTAANAITSLKVYFTHQFSGLPFVCTEVVANAPATADISVGEITETGFTIYLQRTSTTATAILWYAIGNGSNALPE